MYSLFNIKSGIEQVSNTLPDWNYIRDGFSRNFRLIETYYRNNAHAVDPSHILVRILQSIAIPLSLNVERYYANVDPLALTLAAPFQLTSSISTGKIFDGDFYGKGIREVLIANNAEFDPVVATANWKSLRPVHVIRHPFTDLALNIPDGKRRSKEHGVAIVVINIPMLAIQYRAFVLREQARADGPMLNIMQFVHMFVLPNMLGTHLDQALFNRINHVWQERPTVHGKSMHPMRVIDFDSQVTALHERTVKIIQRSDYSFAATLTAIPAMHEITMFDAMRMPDMVPTRQVVWALVLARLNVLVFLIRSQRNGPRQNNNNEVGAIGNTLLMLKRQRVFDSAIPLQLQQDAMVAIDTVVSLSNIPKIV